MTPDDRELAEKLRAYYNANTGPIGTDHPVFWDGMAQIARALIGAELAAKAGPPGDQVPIPQNIMQARGMLLVAENWLTAHDPKFKPNEILATLTAQAEALREENARLREVLENKAKATNSYIQASQRAKDRDSVKILHLLSILEFYGNRMTYTARSGMESGITRDNFGDKARAAIETSTAKEGEW